MASYSRVVMIGNLTRDVEMRYLQSGVAVANVTLAINDKRKEGDELVDEVTFIDVVLWARTAEVANEYLVKGSNVMIEGRLRQDHWEKDGQKHSKIKVTADRLVMLGGKRPDDGGTDQTEF